MAASTRPILVSLALVLAWSQHASAGMPSVTLADVPPLQKPAPSGRKRLRYRLMAGLSLFMSWLIFGFGLGLPYTYWIRISHLQAFEGPEGVTVFIEGERAMRYPGFLQSYRFIGRDSWD